VELNKEESFSFLGFEFRRIRSRKGVGRPNYAPKRKKRKALLAKLREIFRSKVSQPVAEGMEAINPMLRGWVNYFWVGNSSAASEGSETR
jgi:RNA-directed DNA polymerase